MDLKQKIKLILEENIECRNSDNKLILEYIKKHYPVCYGMTNYYKESIDTIRVTPELFLHEVIDWTSLEENNICIESITRCRRQLQKLYPELQATEKVRKGRKEKEKEMMVEYASNKAFSGIFGDMSEKLNNLNIR